MSSIELKTLAVLTAGDLPDRLGAVLSSGQRGGSARRRISPELSYGRHAGPAPYTARSAAVMLLLFRRDGHWCIPLTERPDTLARHAGQISLPGGVVDADESSSDAAIRELNEELGIEQSVQILGRLANCYVFASDFRVTPWVAAADFEPQWKPHDHEVRGVIELPLGILLDEQMTGRVKIEHGPLVFHAPCLRLGTACIWGATGVILGELADALRKCYED